ncbi:flagellar hook-associated protein FlgL [Pseudomonas sp. Gutcm_11s]|uniref:flagellar hook-associated protein FlgL n=1 Tax=Pseudomonas sp. Gutcm_11s TaxID=3026088 RepID=UPI002362F4D6|nr:flagellar hook-associated protein FlgL [Pseudomonas sp. Gutcm_11s]MDD0842022.1 flagellar hook-associated protein FlgL [Pseudomonas sp. Gutcm_11s]
MRITNAQITAMMHSSMNANSAELGKLMQQMSSGQRILQPSDDPIASVRMLRIQREEASLTQFRSNITMVSGNLSTQETNLSAMSDLSLNVRDLLLWAANTGANAGEDVAAMAGELASLEQTLVSYVNVRDEEGRYLFAGTLSDRPAVVFDAATQTYVANGNDKHRQAAVANGVLVDENTTALEIFGPGMDLLNQLHATVTALQDPALDITDPAVVQQIRDTIDQLDLTHGEVLGAITELGGRQNTLTLLNGSNEEVSLVNQKLDGELSQLDYAGASIDLNNYQLALQASQKTYLKINQLSLFQLL